MAELKSTELRSEDRALVLFKGLVESYLKDGLPVGSKTLADRAGLGLSSATVRNIMGELEHLGLLKSPHTSAGRVPTDAGLRLFVDSLLTVKPLTTSELQQVQGELMATSPVDELMRSATTMLAEISQLAGLVAMPRVQRKTLAHIEFIGLSQERIMAVLVTADGTVSNRMIYAEQSYSRDDLRIAGQFLAEHCVGKTLEEMRHWLAGHLQELRDQVINSMQAVTDLANQLVNEDADQEHLLLRGESNLLTETTRPGDMERLRELFAAFDERQSMLALLDSCVDAKGVQVFIGSGSEFSFYEDYSLVAAPYEVAGEVLGVLGVVGPTRMAYDRVVSLVDVTARLVGAAMNR